jgi:hypothetical protein
MTDELTAQLITGAIAVILAAIPAAISWINLQKARHERELAVLERQQAQDAASLALGAASETLAARNEFAALGGFSATDTVSGAPPPRE